MTAQLHARSPEELALENSRLRVEVRYLRGLLGVLGVEGKLGLLQAKANHYAGIEAAKYVVAYMGGE